MEPPWSKKLTDEQLRIINDAARTAVKREAEWAEAFHQKAQRQRLRSPSLERGGVADDEEMEAAWKEATRLENPPGLIQPLPPFYKQPYPPPPQVALKFKAAPMLPPGWHHPQPARGSAPGNVVLAKAYPVQPASSYKPAGIPMKATIP